METHENELEQLSAALDGALSPEEREALDRHLEQCPECRADWEALQAIQEAVSALGETAPPEGFAAQVMERVRQEPQNKPEKKCAPLFRRPWLRAAAGLAACGVICAGLYYGSGTWNPSAAVPGEADSSAGLQADTSEGAAAAEPAPASELPKEEDASAEPEAAAGTPAPPAEGKTEENQAEPAPAPQAAEDSGTASDAEPEGAADPEPAPAETPAVQAEEDDSTALEAGAGLSASQQPASTVPQEKTSQAGGSAIEPSAVLVFPALPEGAEDILGTEISWAQDEEGRSCCTITGEQAEALLALARAQWPDWKELSSQPVAGDGLYTLVLTNGAASEP